MTSRLVIAEEPSVDPKKVTELANNLEAELARLIVGQKELLRDTVIALISGGHILLEGVPGLGKTMLVRSLGQALDLTFSFDLFPNPVHARPHAGRHRRHQHHPRGFRAPGV